MWNNDNLTMITFRIDSFSYLRYHFLFPISIVSNIFYCTLMFENICSVRVYRQGTVRSLFYETWNKFKILIFSLTSKIYPFERGPCSRKGSNRRSSGHSKFCWNCHLTVSDLSPLTVLAKYLREYGSLFHIVFLMASC